MEKHLEHLRLSGYSSTTIYARLTTILAAAAPG
jgi:hypothetical protein